MRHNPVQRILVRWDKREDIWLGMLHLAYSVIAWLHGVLKKQTLNHEPAGEPGLPNYEIETT
jgi:hypothetical protein